MRPDALRYGLVAHAWLRGCQGGGRNSHNQQPQKSNGAAREGYTDRERIERAMAVIDRLEDWTRRTHTNKRRREQEDEEEEEGVSNAIKVTGNDGDRNARADHVGAATDQDGYSGRRPPSPAPPPHEAQLYL